MEKSEAWHEGYNSYWNVSDACPHEEGTTAHADWWAGWEAAVEEDYQSIEEEAAQ